MGVYLDSKGGEGQMIMFSMLVFIVWFMGREPREKYSSDRVKKLCEYNDKY